MNIRTRGRFLIRTFSQTHQLSPVKLSFLKINGREQHKSPVIFLHGMFGNKNNWKSIARQISEATGRTGISVDLRNHGQSPWSDVVGADAMAADVKHFLETGNIQKSIIVGHSMGGRVAFQFASMFDSSAEMIVAVDVSPVSLPNSMGTFAAYIDAMERVTRDVDPASGLAYARRSADQMLQSVIAEKLVRDFLIMNLVKDESGQLMWQFNLKAIRELAVDGRIRKLDLNPSPLDHQDIVFIKGSLSDYLPDADEPAIRKLFPRAKFLTVRNAGHYLHVEKQKEFVKLLTDCIESQ